MGITNAKIALVEWPVRRLVFIGVLYCVAQIIICRRYSIRLSQALLKMYSPIRTAR